MAHKVKDIFDLKIHFACILNRPLPRDKKAAKELNSLKKQAHYYLMEIFTAEKKLEKLSIYGAQVKYIFSEDDFYKELNKFSNYDIIFSGEYVQVVELYSYNHMVATTWVMWCKEIAD